MRVENSCARFGVLIGVRVEGTLAALLVRLLLRPGEQIELFACCREESKLLFARLKLVHRVVS